MRLTETNVVAPKIRVKKIGKVHTVVKVCVFHEAELLTLPESWFFDPQEQDVYCSAGLGFFLA
jgi:hypothetical protein